MSGYLYGGSNLCEKRDACYAHVPITKELREHTRGIHPYLFFCISKMNRQRIIETEAEEAEWAESEQSQAMVSNTGGPVDKGAINKKFADKELATVDKKLDVVNVINKKLDVVDDAEVPGSVSPLWKAVVPIALTPWTNWGSLCCTWFLVNHFSCCMSCPALTSQISEMAYVQLFFTLLSVPWSAVAGAVQSRFNSVVIKYSTASNVSNRGGKYYQSNSTLNTG